MAYLVDLEGRNEDVRCREYEAVKTLYIRSYLTLLVETTLCNVRNAYFIVANCWLTA